MARQVQTAGRHVGEPVRFISEKATEDWGNEQEPLIRRNLWLDPRDAETLFGLFVEDWFAAVRLRLEPNIAAKYRSAIVTICVRSGR